MKIRLTRLGDGATDTNVPHKKVRHSPTGFEWGYGGSGPADLALNILLMFIPERLADELYQEFKWDVISHIPKSGAEISEESVRAWIRKHTQGDELG